MQTEQHPLWLSICRTHSKSFTSWLFLTNQCPHTFLNNSHIYTPYPHSMDIRTHLLFKFHHNLPNIILLVFLIQFQKIQKYQQIPYDDLLHLVFILLLFLQKIWKNLVAIWFAQEFEIESFFYYFWIFHMRPFVWVRKLE